MKKLIRYLLKKYGSYDIDNIGGLERMNKRRAWCAENVETLGLSELLGCLFPLSSFIFRIAASPQQCWYYSLFYFNVE